MDTHSFQNKALRKSSKTCQDLHAWCMEKMKVYPDVKTFQVVFGQHLGTTQSPITIGFEDLFLVYNSSEIDEYYEMLCLLSNIVLIIIFY